MAACEKCWAEASFRARLRGMPVVDEYYRLLAENDDYCRTLKEVASDARRDS